MSRWMKAAVAALFLSAASAQDEFEFLDTPVPVFSEPGGAMGEGNAVTISPDGAVLYVTRADGTLDGLDPSTGLSLAGFPVDPSSFATGSSFTCQSGVSIYAGDGPTGPYVAYSVIADEGSTFTAAISHPDGAVLWGRESPGIAEGTPVISGDGVFVYQTHNEDSIGWFSVLDATDEGEVFYTEEDTNQTFAYTAPAIYHNPPFGNYIGGFDAMPNQPPDTNNMNDILAWSATSVPFSNAEGRTFAFQLPFDFVFGTSDASGLAVNPLADTGWQSRNPPAIANPGTELFFGITRNQFRGWIPTDTLRGRWDNAATASTSDRWGRGDPRFNDPPNTPVLNSATTLLFCGMASPFFVALNADTFTLDEMWNQTTASIVLTDAVLSLDESVVFFAESDPAVVHSTMTADGTDIFAQGVGTGDPISSEISLSPDGTVLFFGQESGQVTGWQVGSTGPAPPTMTPTTPPPTMTPAPSVGDTGAPTTTAAPSESASPSYAPSTSSMPSEVTMMPSAATTPEPTPGDTPDDTPEPTPDATTPPDPTPEPTPSAASQSACAILSVFAAVAVAFFLN